MAIPGGMQMMLKSMGIDSSVVMESIEGFKKIAENMEDTQKAIDSKLKTLPVVDGKLDLVLAKCYQILGELSGVDQSAMPETWLEVTPKELEGIPAEV